MKSYLDLIPISARVHKKQTRMTRLCIVLAVFLVTVIFSMADMEIRAQKQQAIQSDGAWHAAFRDINDTQAALIAARPEAKYGSWYGVLNYRLDENYLLADTQAVICGFDEALLELMPAAQLAEGSFPADGEAVLTQSAQEQLGLQTGEQISLVLPDGSQRVFTISGFTGNTSLLTEEDAFGIFVNTATFRTFFSGEAGEHWYDSTYYVSFSGTTRIEKTISEITSALQLDDNQVLRNSKLLGIIGQSTDSFMLQLYGTAAVLALLVITAGVLMISSNLNSNVARRTEFFGLLRCLGATPGQISRFVRREALNWCKTALPMGVLSGVVLTWGLCWMLKVVSPTYFEQMPALGVSWPGILAGLLIGLVTVLLAAQSPARKAARVSPLTAVSGNAGTVQAVRKAANTRFLKVETALGIHHATAGKKNYWLMVGSFAFSIILFLAFNTSIDFMHHALRPLQPYSPDISIISEDNSCSIPAELQQQLAAAEGVKKAFGRMFAYGVPVVSGEQQLSANLISYEQYQLAWAQKSLLAGELEDAAAGEGVLLVYSEQNQVQLGDSLTIDGGSGPQQVTVCGLLSDSPFAREENSETIICSESLFTRLTGATNYTIIDLQLTRAADDQDVAVLRELAGTDFTFSDRRLGVREAKGAYYSMALFLYGFLAIIALIAVFNIINSIAMSVAARMRQYGAMRAIGLSDRQLARMIIAEAVTYALSGMLVGCLAGLPVNYLLFSMLVTYRWGDSWQVPLLALFLILAVVGLAALAAVYGPVKRIKKLSIVDTIRDQ